MSTPRRPAREEPRKPRPRRDPGRGDPVPPARSAVPAPARPEEPAPSDARLAELVQRLGGRSPKSADKAVRQLARYGAPAVPALVDALGGGREVLGFGIDGGVDAVAKRRRRRAEGVLVRIGPEAVAPLAEALRTRKGRVRRGVARALGELGAPGQAVLLSALFEGRTRAAARAGLEAAGKAAVPALAAFLRRERRGSAAWHAADTALCRIMGAPTLRQTHGGGTLLAFAAAGIFAAVFVLVLTLTWRNGLRAKEAATFALVLAYLACGAVLIQGTPFKDLHPGVQGLMTPVAPLIYWFWPGIRARERRERDELERKYLAAP